MKNKILIALTGLLLIISPIILAQESEQLSREDVLGMSVEELSDMPFEDLMSIMDVMGVSSMDEIINVIMNKGVESASKKVENAFDAPISSTVLTREEIESYGATTFEEALRLVPGVIVREKTNGYYDVHLRGLDNIPPRHMLIFSQNKNTLLMIDGRPVFNYVHGGTLWETLPIGFEDLDRIEVIRGPSSALYGPNAVNGVINLITRDVSDKTSMVSGSASAGTLNTYMGEIAVQNSWNNGISTGITSNFQHRNREMEKIYFFPNNNASIERVISDSDGSSTNIDEGGFFTLDEYDRMKNIYQGDSIPVLESYRKVYDKFEDGPEKGKENMGVNMYFQYNSKSDFSLNFSSGFQSSYLNGSALGDSPTSYWGRTSESAYANVIGQVENLHFQTNYMAGNRNFQMGASGFHLDIGQFNASMEYDLQLKSLNIRPGVSFQSVQYDDTPYLDDSSTSSGYLNGKKELNTTSVSLRADYMAFGKLRLIAALRAEKYTDPDPVYPSWQFATTYPITENRILRAVYSRANNSSLLLNTHSDYSWNRSELGIPPTTLHFKGTPDINLMTVDMIEIGFRSRLFKSLLVDAEIFGAKSRDFISLDADSASLTPTSPTTAETYTKIAFRDTPLEATQIGASVNIDWIISEQLIFRGHANLQQTMLDNYSPYSKLEGMAMQLELLRDRAQRIGAGEINPSDEKAMSPVEMKNGSFYTNFSPSDNENDFEHDFEHKATPRFWGMAGLVYRPTDKWEFSSNGYYTGKQTFINQNATFNIDSKLIVNAKASYKPVDNIEIFLHGHNILNNNSVEFAFMDPVGTLYTGGIRFNF